jgi:hypothetical protein
VPHAPEAHREVFLQLIRDELALGGQRGYVGVGGE